MPIRPLWPVLTLALLASVAVQAQSTPTQPAPTDGLGRIGHIVVIFEENRSFDNMFGTFPGANGIANAAAAATQIGPDGKPYKTLPQPFHIGDKKPDPRFPANLPNKPFEMSRFVPIAEKTGDLIHAFFQEPMQINDGAMNRFAAVSNAAGLAMGYYDTSKTQLWKLARQFTLGDAMFHSAFGGSFLNHAFLVCSCAFRYPDAPADIVSKVDANGVLLKNGSVTADGFAVNTLHSVQLHDPKQKALVPAQTMPHIGDRLDAAGVDWAWYSGGYADAMAGKAAPMFQFHHQALAYFQNLAPGTPAQQAHLRDYSDMLEAIAHNTLPPVVFYKPIGEVNEHPGYAEIMSGDHHLAELITRLQASPAYKDMLILITYDENGGFWDHVAPPRRDRWGPGTRVPLIAIGPTVKRGFVDHTPYDFGSILRTITRRFGAQPVNEIDANAYPIRGVLQ